jgi:predicted nucleic acid-binding protein
MGKVEKLLTKLQGQRVYIDANYLIYFLDRHKDYIDIVSPIFQSCDKGEFLGFTGDAAVSEVMVHPYRSKTPSEIARGKSLFTREGFLTILHHDADAFDLTAQLRATSTMRMLDALHYATALRAGCRFMLTNDRDFKSTSALEVISISTLVEI